MPRYARNGDVSLAYDVHGDGERDILVTFGWIGSFQSAWDNAAFARWMQRLGTLGRLILWDKRGTGLSERMPPERLPTLEERMDDMRVVLDAAGSERAVALGFSEGVGLNVVFAASHPERVSSLIAVGGFARTLHDDDYDWAAEPDRVLATVVFTDIVDSTGRAAELGDRRWRDLVEEHDRLVRARLERYVKDLVAGSGLGFADRGEHELKGVPGSWRLYAVEGA
jgi:pimeloyl-ACP methyl ester carboxylesterase